MAVKDFTLNYVTRSTMSVTWSNLQNGDTGEILSASQWSIVAFEITGTKGTGGELAFDFSASAGSSYWKEATPFSDVPTYQETTQFVNGAFRPNITGGDGSTDLALTVILMPYGKNI